MKALLAREPELERLNGALEQALNGRAALVFVTGEAGSGKSALLSEFRVRARSASADVAVATGTCDAQTGTADPYLPFREVLGELTGASATSYPADEAGEMTQLSRWVVASARALVEHAPDLVDILVPGGAILTKLGTRAMRHFTWAERLAEITRGRAGQGSTAVALTPEHVFEQYTALVRGIAREHPLVIVLDDLHWVDSASAGLLFHLARRLDQDRVLLIGAYRAADVALGRNGERHPMDAIVNELRRYHGDIGLSLGEEPREGQRFIDALIDAEVPGIGTRFRDELFQHTGGHPLFAVELLRHLQDVGAIAVQGDGTWAAREDIEWAALPARVDGVIGERAARLDLREREILSVAAVEGQDFTAEVVAAVLGAEPRDVVRTLSGELEKRHRLVLARGIERVNGTRIAGYAFRHSLFQSWFYGRLDEVERAYTHESVGRALERIYGNALDGVENRLARHFTEADQPVEAIRYLLLAGDRALATSANSEAAERYRDAAAMLERAHSQFDDGLAAEYRARIDEGQGVLAELGGNHDLATSHFSAALQALDAAQGQELTLLRARIARRSAKPLENQRRYPEAAARLDDAERLLGDDWHEDRERAGEWLQIQLARIWVAYWRAQIDVMEEIISRAAPQVERWGKPHDRAVFHYGRALLGMRRERFLMSDATLEAAREALRASQQGGRLNELGLAEFGVGFVHMWRFELDQAQHFLEQAAVTAHRAGDRTLETRPLIYRSVTARFRGDVADALLWADRAEAVARTAELDEYIGSAYAQRAWAAWRARDHEAVREQAGHALRTWEVMPYEYPLLWLALLPLMAVEVAEERYQEAAALAAAMLPINRVQLREPAWSALERVAGPAESGDPSLAERVRDAVRAAGEAGYL